MRRLPDAAVALLGTVVVLGSLELGLRASGFRYAHHPVSMRYVSSIAGLGVDQTAHRKRFHVDYTLDHVLLWRPVEWPAWPERRGALRRLITLGDSCTVAGEDPYPTLLPARLRDWDVMNAGVGSWSSYQGLKLLETRLSAERPDAVSVYFGWNDHWLAWAAPDKDLASLLDAQWRTFQTIERSRLLQALLKLADLARGGGAPKLAAARPFRVSEDDYEANLRRIVAAARSAGARPLLLTAPSALTPDHPVTRHLCETTRNFDDPARIVRVHEAYNERVRKVARETGATLVDLARTFAERPDAPSLFTDGIHLSPKGHALAAERLAAALVSSK